MKQLDRASFLDMFDASIHDALIDAAQKPGTVALVAFENQAFDSSAFGARSALRVGDGCTYASVETTEGKWLNDLPSQRQYPVGFVLVSDLVPNERKSHLGEI